MDEQPVLPTYAGANLRGIMPALLGPSGTRPAAGVVPRPVRQARAWSCCSSTGSAGSSSRTGADLAPTLHALAGGPITTVVPSTTATALTSITTGLTPGEHGIVGYRIDLGGEVLNVLRWCDRDGDARKRFVPAEIQPFPAFLGQPCRW